MVVEVPVIGNLPNFLTRFEIPNGLRNLAKRYHRSMACSTSPDSRRPFTSFRSFRPRVNIMSGTVFYPAESAQDRGSARSRIAAVLTGGFEVDRSGHSDPPVSIVPQRAQYRLPRSSYRMSPPCSQRQDPVRENLLFRFVKPPEALTPHWKPVEVLVLRRLSRSVKPRFRGLQAAIYTFWCRGKSGGICMGPAGGQPKFAGP